MTSIGCYAFTLDDWKEKDYPLDLWLEASTQIFDQVALVYGGSIEESEIDFSQYPNLIVSEEIPRGDGRQYWMKQIAQDLLTTEWRMILDIDEFLVRRPEPAPSSIHMHVLWGDVNHEIVGPTCHGVLPWVRLHRGHAEVLGDGCRVGGQGPTKVVDIYHTTLLRRPHWVMYRTWLWKQMEDWEFSYDKWKEYWPDARLMYVNDSELPEILLEHKERFKFQG